MQQLKIVKKLVKASKEFFDIKIEIVWEQVQDIEAKSVRLEKKMRFFLVKKWKLSQLPEIIILAFKKNLEQPKKK